MVLCYLFSTVVKFLPFFYVVHFCTLFCIRTFKYLSTSGCGFSLFKVRYLHNSYQSQPALRWRVSQKGVYYSAVDFYLQSNTSFLSEGYFPRIKEVFFATLVTAQVAFYGRNRNFFLRVLMY